MFNRVRDYVLRFLNKQNVEPRQAVPKISPSVQYGALPYRIVDGKLEVLLVTSKGRGWWIFPKGRAMKGLSAWETAAQEAREEAGIDGEIESQSIGSYFLPITEERLAPIEVQIFPMKVTMQADEWKESAIRQRRWVSSREAKSMINHVGLADVVSALEARENSRTSVAI